jgi:hypothetical protein
MKETGPEAPVTLRGLLTPQEVRDWKQPNTARVVARLVLIWAQLCISRFRSRSASSLRSC